MDGDLARYLKPGAFKFDMHFGHCQFGEFFGRTNDHDEIVSQRKQILCDDPQPYLAILPEAASLLDETLELAVEARTVPANLSTALELGLQWEPDYLLLQRSSTGTRLVCGCVCFPSSWSLADKIGRPIEAIHQIVPNLNSSIGIQIETFLKRLKPGVTWTRSNWGLSRLPNLNQHPSLGLARLHEEVSGVEVFFRVEEQALVALPRNDGILFGIRVKVFPLKRLMGTCAGQTLAHMLKTMPEEMARYKGIATARERIIDLLTK